MQQQTNTATLTNEYPSQPFEKRIHHYKQWQCCFKTQQFTVDLSFISITIRLYLSQIDLPTFLTLTDQDLKELGITTFGARRKMLLAIAGESVIETWHRPMCALG